MFRHSCNFPYYFDDSDYENNGYGRCGRDRGCPGSFEPAAACASRPRLSRGRALRARGPLADPPLEVHMKALIEYIAKSLVDNPEEVQVSEVEGEQTTVLELKVAKEDLGKVIGKQGRTARAMRTILSAASIKCKKRTVLEILE